MIILQGKNQRKAISDKGMAIAFFFSYFEPNSNGAQWARFRHQKDTALF